MPEFTREHLTTVANMSRHLQFVGTEGVSEGEVDVLRRIVQDGDFRASFVKDPLAAIDASGVKLAASEVVALSKLNANHANVLADGIARMAADGDGTHTLAYAVVLAVVIAVLMAMPNPEGLAAFAVR